MTPTAISETVKLLGKELEKAQAGLQASQVELKGAQSRVAMAQNEVRSLTKRIDDLRAMINSADEPVVSDHAVLRWLERHHGMDINAVKAEILDGQTARLVKFAVSGNVTKGDRTLVVKNRVVVTVK